MVAAARRHPRHRYNLKRRNTGYRALSEADVRAWGNDAMDLAHQVGPQVRGAYGLMRRAVPMAREAYRGVRGFF